MRFSFTRSSVLPLAVVLTALCAGVGRAQGTAALVGLYFRGPDEEFIWHGGRLCDLTPGPLDSSCGVSGLRAQLRPSFRGTVLRAESRLQLDDVRPTPQFPPPSDATRHEILATADVFDVRDEITFAGFEPAYVRVSWRLDGELMALATRPGNTIEIGAELFLDVLGWGFLPDDEEPGPWVHEQRTVIETPSLGAQDQTSRQAVSRRGHVDLPFTASGSAVDFATLEMYLFTTVRIRGPLGEPLDGTAGNALRAHLAITALDEQFRDVTGAARPVFASGRSYRTALIPEPATLLLVGAGAAGVGLIAVARRRPRG